MTVGKIPVGKIHWRRDRLPTAVFLGFPGGSAGKESAHSMGDLGWEDPLEKGEATLSSILGWRIPSTEEPGGLQSMGLPKSRTQLSDFHFHTFHTPTQLT